MLLPFFSHPNQLGSDTQFFWISVWRGSIDFIVAEPMDHSRSKGLEELAMWRMWKLEKWAGRWTSLYFWVVIYSLWLLTHEQPAFGGKKKKEKGKKSFCLVSGRAPSSEVILEGRKILFKNREHSLFYSCRHPALFVVSHPQSKFQPELSKTRLLVPMKSKLLGLSALLFARIFSYDRMTNLSLTLSSHMWLMWFTETPIRMTLVSHARLSSAHKEISFHLSWCPCLDVEETTRRTLMKQIKQCLHGKKGLVLTLGQV